MAKQTGITTTVVIADSGGTDRTISGAVRSFTTSQSREQIDVTGVDKDFMERLPGLGDWSVTFQGVLDNVANGQHSVFRSMGTALRNLSISFSSGGTAVGTAAVENYVVNRAENGALTWTATVNCANGTALTWS